MTQQCPSRESLVPNRGKNVESFGRAGNRLGLRRELLVPFLDIGQHRFNMGILGLFFAKLALRGVCFGELGLGARFGFPRLLQSAR